MSTAVQGHDRAKISPMTSACCTTGIRRRRLQQHDLAYTEVYGSLTFKGFKFGVNYSDNYFAEQRQVHVSVHRIRLRSDRERHVELPLRLQLVRRGAGGSRRRGLLPGLEDPGHSTKWLGVNWALAYVDTDLDDDEDCYGDKQLCAPRRRCSRFRRAFNCRRFCVAMLAGLMSAARRTSPFSGVSNDHEERDLVPMLSAANACASPSTYAI